MEPGGDSILWNNYTVTIPTVLVTMEEGDNLQSLVKKNKKNTMMDGKISVIIYSRWEPTYDVSSILIWMLGVLVCSFAAYTSAKEYHIIISKFLTKYRRLQQQEQQQSPQQQQSSSSRQRAPPSNRRRPQEETLELEPIHAVFFLVMASTSLLVLFYFKVTKHECNKSEGTDERTMDVCFSLRVPFR